MIKMNKLKYKLWKHLTKGLLRDGVPLPGLTYDFDFARQFLIEKPESIKSQSAKVSLPNAVSKKIEPTGADITSSEMSENVPTQMPTIIALQGIYYSGSSALVGMFQEFDNTRVVGNSDAAWSKSCDKVAGSECCFFGASGFIDMILAFRKEPPEVVNFRIRKFISSIKNAYKNKRIASWENLPYLYNDTFRKITQELLLSIIDLDEPTKAFMQDRIFPHGAWENDVTTYDACNFTKGEGKRKYLAYQFADISEEEFNRHISEYLEQFFKILSGKEFIIYDQLLPRKYLEVVNKYMRVPIKQVLVIRDPRDQFLSADRRDITWLPRTSQGFINHNINRLKEFPLENPNRIVVRFEDLVLNYEQEKTRVLEFIGLDTKHHVAPKSIFDPAISVANVGAWKHYHRQEFMKEIEEGLRDYCFYPEREELSDEARLLLKSSGNWDDVL